MSPHDPYASLAAPRRAADDDARSAGAAIAVAVVLIVAALIAAALLPLGPRRGIDKLLCAPSAVAEDR